VPRFEPFPGIRYDERTHDLAQVTAPPYDVIDAAERGALAARHPRNVVHVDVPVGDDPYTRAAETFNAWRDDGYLVTDGPSLYLYRMRFTDEAGAARHTLGVLGALGMEHGEPKGVLPHEHTTPKARSDRLDLLRATHANLSPIWGLSLASGLTKLLDPERAQLIGSWDDDDGVGHDLWRVDDESEIAAICEAVGSAPVVVADGHHRYETARAFALEQPDLPAVDGVLCFVVELIDDELTVRPIHRLVRGVPADFDFVGALEPWFEVSDGGGPITLVQPGGTRGLTPRTERFADVADLDTARLQAALDAALPAHEVIYQHGADAIRAAVASGEAVAGFLMEPVSVEQIAATARARQKMPPKTTFFWPKLRTGTVFRSLS
jgi:uncharacterized protein (DUF1015 family)